MQTKVGANKWKQTMIAKLGEEGFKEYMSNLGKKGADKTGFHKMEQSKRRAIAAKGGRISRRRK